MEEDLWQADGAAADREGKRYTPKELRRRVMGRERVRIWRLRCGDSTSSSRATILVAVKKYRAVNISIGHDLSHIDVWGQDQPPTNKERR